MRTQLKRLGFSYDWDRELATCDLDYYRWEQWLFLKMYERGLVYRKKSLVNWCEPCQTVLANEQVEDGACWRCGTRSRRRSLPSGFSASPATPRSCWHRDRLPGWPEKVLTMQRNWIGRSYRRGDRLFRSKTADEKITVFTTRPDTLYGATFMSLAPEHPWR